MPRNWTTTSEFVVGCSHLKSLFTSSSVRKFQASFLQVDIKEEEFDAIRFHWLIDKDPNLIETYQFTRALFGIVKLPFILGGALTTHIGGCKERYQIEVDGILRSLS